MITEYKIVSEVSSEKLERMIGELLRIGWELHGNLSVTFTHRPPYSLPAVTYTQVLVWNSESGR